MEEGAHYCSSVRCTLLWNSQEQMAKEVLGVGSSVALAS